jgi:hypothetical protein
VTNPTALETQEPFGEVCAVLSRTFLNGKRKEKLWTADFRG